MSTIHFPVNRCRPPGAKHRLGHDGRPIDWAAVAVAEKRLERLLALHRARSETAKLMEEYFEGVF